MDLRPFRVQWICAHFECNGFAPISSAMDLRLPGTRRCFARHAILNATAPERKVLSLLFYVRLQLPVEVVQQRQHCRVIWNVAHVVPEMRILHDAVFIHQRL
jgi:hypothetical protein